MKPDQPTPTVTTATAICREALPLPTTEVEDMLGGVPHWIVRAGSMHLLGLVVALAALLWFIEYPEVVTAPIAITAEVPPVRVHSKESGQLKFRVTDNAQVEPGQILGEIVGSADAASVAALRRELAGIRTALHAGQPLAARGSRLALGELQEGYSALIDAVQQLRIHDAGNVHAISRQADARRLEVLVRVSRESRQANTLAAENASLARQAFERDQGLFRNRLLSLSDLEARKQRMIEVERDYRTAELAVTNLEGEIELLRATIEKSARLEQVERENLLNRAERELADLEASIARWEEIRLLKAPIAGRVVFHKYWSDFQHVPREQEVLVVWPASDRVVGKATASAAAAGRLQIGQRVVVRATEFPHQEYGTIEGAVAAIAKHDGEAKYVITVAFPHGLVTNRGHTLAPGQGMAGSADIITEDLRLLERVFQQFRRLFTRDPLEA